MKYEIIVFSTISKDLALKTSNYINTVITPRRIHCFAESENILLAYEKIAEISKSSEAILVIDEIFRPKKELFEVCDSATSSMRFSAAINENISMQMGTLLKSEDVISMSFEEFYGSLWGKHDCLEKFNIGAHLEDLGTTNQFRDGLTTFYYAKKIKYFVETFGDKEDIEYFMETIKNEYFLEAKPELINGINKGNKELLKISKSLLKIKDEASIEEFRYFPSGKGLVFIPLKNMEESFSIRYFCASLRNQTYLNFDIVVFGPEVDVRDFSNYCIDGVRFKITSSADFLFVNEEVRDSNYDWYSVVNHRNIYENDFIEKCISSGRSLVGILSSKSKIENHDVISKPALDKKTVFFKKDAIKSLGYFDPINYFSPVEYLNRASSLGYLNFGIITERMAIISDLELNHAIDEEKVLFDGYISQLNSGYSVNKDLFLIKPIKDVPLELVSRYQELKKGDVFVSKVIVRTLGNEDRYNNILSQLKEREIGNYEFWQNTRRDSDEISNLHKSGMTRTDGSCYQCDKEECSHIKVLTDGQIANFYSMISLFKSIESNDDYDESLYLIMEDDVLLSKNFVEVINEKILDEKVLDNIDEPLLLRVGWGDMLEYRRDHYVEYTDRYEWKESFKRFANPCFIVNKHAVKKYLNNFKKYDRACDQWVHTEVGMDMKNFSLYPPICKELSHVGLISSDMHPKASSYEYKQLQFMKTGNINYYNDAARLKKEYDDFWG